MDSRVALRGSTLATASFLYFYYRPYWTHDSNVTFSRSIVGSLEENKVAGLCFGFGNMLALVPQAVGGGASHIITVLVVDPTNVA